MKKIFLLSTVIAIFNLIVSAQIKKGSILLGGQISFYDINTHFNTTQPEQKSKSAIFNISGGKALQENRVLGLSISYTHSYSDYLYNNNGNVYFNTNADVYNFDIFYRQYKKLAKDFYLFGQLATGYIGGTQTDTDMPGSGKTKYTKSGAELFLTPGVAYRIYKKLQVELLIPQVVGINYSVQKTTLFSNPANDYRQTIFTFNTNLNSSFLNNLGLGFKFVL